MVHRIFAYDDLPCRVTIEISDADPLKAKLMKVTSAKAIVASEHALPTGATFPVQLEFPSGSTIGLVAAVVESGARGLFLRFQHSTDKAESALQAQLIEEAEKHSVLVKETREVRARELRKTILSKATTVSSRSLAARQDNVRVINMSSISGLIQAAVEEAMGLSEHAWTEAERRKLLEEAEHSFNERLAAMKLEKTSAEEKAALLQEQYSRAQQLLETERQREIESNQFTMSELGMAELEHRMSRILEHALSKGAASDETKAELREIVEKLLDEERDRISEQARDAHNEAIALLERKVSRLASTLESTTKERDLAQRRAKALEAAGGGVLGNMYTVGIDGDDPDREAKLALLKELMKDNRDVRSFITTNQTTAPTPLSSEANTGDGGVKKISVKRAAPPPLQKTE